MIFLGTGAAEQIPNPFCSCEVCRYALASDDPKEHRLRSSFLLDSENIIDMGPDVTGAAGRYGVSLAGIKNIFYTHFHSDHFALSAWDSMRMSIEVQPDVNIYLSQEALNGLYAMKKLLTDYHDLKYKKLFTFLEAHIHPVVVVPYETFSVGNMQVTGLPTIHEGQFVEEHARNYLFEREGKRLLYACDTGLYCEENYEFLRSRPLDILIIEGTFGADIQPDSFKHMTLATMTRMVERFRKEGIVTEQTAIYITHIGHKGKLTHRAYVQRASEVFGSQAAVAYDGMEIGGF